MVVDADRRERRSVEERRDELVDAAITVVAEEGLANATTRRITQHAGVALGAFHYAFASKSELVAAVMGRIATRVEEAIDGAITGTPGTLADAVNEVLVAYESFVESDPPLQLARQELTVRALRDPRLRGLVGEQRERAQAAAVRALSATDTARDADLDSLASYLVATFDGLVLHRLVDPEGAASRVDLHRAALAALLEHSSTNGHGGRPGASG